MKAYRIKWMETRQDVTVECRYELPYVRCGQCGREWGEGLVQFPALNFPFLREPRFRKRIVDVEGFREIKNCISTAAGYPINVVPGSSFGPLEGKADKLELNDFIWGSICVPQISRRARDLLVADGIELLIAEAFIVCGRRRLDYLAIQAEPVPMLTEKSLEQARITFCKKCGDYFQNHPCPDIAGHYKLRRNAWPRGRHLVQLMETLDVIASETFMASVARHHLSGIRFIEYGEFV
jgi:hypothetical protein